MCLQNKTSHGTPRYGQICALRQGERRIRGTAIYPHASLINHECLPNVARTDNFDAPDVQAPNNTAVCLGPLLLSNTMLHTRVAKSQGILTRTRVVDIP